MISPALEPQHSEASIADLADHILLSLARVMGENLELTAKSSHFLAERIQALRTHHGLGTLRARKRLQLVDPRLYLNKLLLDVVDTNTVVANLALHLVARRLTGSVKHTSQREHHQPRHIVSNKTTDRHVSDLVPFPHSYLESVV